LLGVGEVVEEELRLSDGKYGQAIRVPKALLMIWIYGKPSVSFAKVFD
jgi:hypothetical protein